MCVNCEWAFTTVLAGPAAAAADNDNDYDDDRDAFV